jgi:hypothetical protein
MPDPHNPLPGASRPMQPNPKATSDMFGARVNKAEVRFFSAIFFLKGILIY